ncbi:tRNase Z [Martiniozyma asiatica (nom. inval.)]|nr:tRNase Z [Martiniozyma asiatica]
MSYDLIAVTHPTRDISKPSLILVNQLTGGRSIIGNVSGGLQRKCNEMHIKTGRLTDIFLTGKLDWSSISGLPGMILTVSDQGVSNLNIYHSGNNVLDYMISCWRYFVYRFGLDLNSKDIEQPTESQNVTFTPITIKPSNNLPDNSANKIDLEKLKILVTGIFPKPQNSTLPVFNPKHTADITLPKSIVNPQVSACWIMTPNKVRGKFQVKKALDLGIPKNKFKELCRFESVSLDDGRVIQPEQVLDPTQEFNPVLIIDIPSIHHLENTLSQNWNSLSPNGLPYSAVYHFIDESIKDPLANGKYSDFIKSFDKSTTHFISHKSYCTDNINFKGAYRVSLKWKTLLPSFFPLGKWESEPEIKISKEEFEGFNVFPLTAGQKFTIRTGVNAKVDALTVNGTDETITSEEEFCQLYDEEIAPVGLGNAVSKDEFVKMISDRNSASYLMSEPDPNVPLKNQVETFILGTGSALPQRYRNVICSMVRIPKDQSTFQTVVLDAGEGSLGMLKRNYNEKEIDQIFSELSMIYLSHLHADHHLGIVDFLKEWSERHQNDDGKRLYLITPWQFPKFLKEINQMNADISLDKICYLSCEEFVDSNKKRASSFDGSYAKPWELSQVPIENISIKEWKNSEICASSVNFTSNGKLVNEFYKDLALANAEFCYAKHCEFSYSCAFSFKMEGKEKDKNEEFKLSYSGDTRPRYEFSQVAKHSDLLLHESTLEDAKYFDACDKRHSTTSEAIHVGILMEAKKIILTHFSQRYRSFDDAGSVYERLQNPMTRSNFTYSHLIKGEQIQEKGKEKADLEQPIELHSAIFINDLNENAKKNSANIEILFAFDNMHIRYDEIGKQRVVFERDGDKFDALFSYDNKSEEESSKKVDLDLSPPSKIKKEQKSKDQSKKRKL